MATEWHQSGPFGQIEPPVAKRRSTDATLTDVWSEKRRRLRVKKKESKGKRATELASILHIIALVGAVKYSHSWNWRSRCSQLVMWWVVCVCVCVCVSACTYCCSDTGVSLKQKGSGEVLRKVKKENNFLALCFRRCNDPSSSSMKVTWRVTAETDVALLDKRHARQDEERYFSELFSVLFTLCSNNQSCLRTCLSSANSVRLMLQGNEQKIQVDRSSADL